MLALSKSDPHPSLPSMWTATTKEDEVGVVWESENFVFRPDSYSNPDAKWTNYTDGSCQRLIYQPNNYDGARYLLGCDALDCCTEPNEGGTVEYQIPNVHPAALAQVHHTGQETFTRFDGVTVTADVYEWKFTVETYNAFVTTDNVTGDNATLHKWIVRVEGDNFTNQYANYTEVPQDQAEAFRAQFYVPDVCHNAMSCNGAREKGLLSDKSWKFLHHGTTTGQKLRLAANADKL